MELRDFFVFEKFVSPVLIKIMYWVGLAIIGLFVLVSIGGVTRFDYYVGSSGASVGHMLLVLVIGAFVALLWRVWCEFLIVVFSINDRLAGLPGSNMSVLASSHPQNRTAV